MRAFIALALPAAFEEDVAGLARSLRGVVEGRFMARDTYHVTLAFLGEVDEAAARKAMDALDAACAGAPPVSLRSDGLGTFGRARDATLYLRLAETPELMQLASSVRAELAARDIAFDGKRFRPHITLARRAHMASDALAELAFPAPDVACDVVLFKSTLRPEGASYKELYAVALG